MHAPGAIFGDEGVAVGAGGVAADDEAVGIARDGRDLEELADARREGVAAGAEHRAGVHRLAGPRDFVDGHEVARGDAAVAVAWAVAVARGLRLIRRGDAPVEGRLEVVGAERARVAAAAARERGEKEDANDRRPRRALENHGSIKRTSVGAGQQRRAAFSCDLDEGPFWRAATGRFFVFFGERRKRAIPGSWACTPGVRRLGDRYPSRGESRPTCR